MKDKLKELESALDSIYDCVHSDLAEMCAADYATARAILQSLIESSEQEERDRAMEFDPAQCGFYFTKVIPAIWRLGNIRIDRDIYIPEYTIDITEIDPYLTWPIGWTRLQPLETDKFQLWLRLHGKSSRTEDPDKTPH